MTQQVPLRKTVIIGLGGTGAEVAVNFKKEFIERFGKLPGAVQIRVFDTDFKTRNSYAVTKDGEQIKFSDVEYTLMPVEEPEAQLEQPTVKPWVPTKFMASALQELKISGAGQFRTSGRLALFLNVEEVQRDLDSAIGGAGGFTAKKLLSEDPRFALSLDPRVNIYIICSLAGGSGSGIFLDVANICRALSPKAAARRMVGVFLLPAVFRSVTAAELIYGNTYAASMELDYCQNELRDSGDSFNVDYGGGLKEITWGGRSSLFDHIYIVDNRQEALGSGEVPRVDMMKFIARAVFLNTLVESQGQGQDILDNMANQILNFKTWEGKRRSYMSWGISTMELPMDSLHKLLVYEAVRGLCAELMSINQATVDDDFKSVTKELQLSDESTLKENILPTTTSFEVGVLNEPRKIDAERQLPQWAEEQEKKLYNEELGPIAKANCADLQKKAIDKFQTLLSAYLKRGQIANAFEFFKTLHTHLASLEKRLNDARPSNQFSVYSRGEYKDQSKPSVYPRDVVESTKGVFKGDEKLKAYEVWRATLTNARVPQLKKHLQVNYAYNFLMQQLTPELGEETSIVGMVEQLKKSLEELVKLIGSAKDAVQTTLSNISLAGDDPFTIYLGREFVDSLAKKVSLSDMVAEGTVNATSWIGQTKPEQVTNDLRAFAESQLAELKEENIERVLKARYKANPEGVIDLLKRFIELAQPFWQVKQDTKTPLQDFIIMGVPSGEANYLVENLKRANELKIKARDLKFAPLPDRYKMFGLVYKAAVPLFAVDGMQTFRDNYLASEGEDRTFHISKAWVNGQGLPPLGKFKEPEAIVREKLMYWAVALTEEEPFKLVWRDGSHNYYAKPTSEKDKKRGKKQISIAKGRLEAFEKFKDDPDMYNGIKEEIEAIKQAKGIEALEPPLRRQQQRLREAADKMEEGELKEHLEAEIEAVTEFIDSMKGIQ